MVGWNRQPQANPSECCSELSRAESGAGHDPEVQLTAELVAPGEAGGKRRAGSCCCPLIAETSATHLTCALNRGELEVSGMLIAAQLNISL